MIPFSELPKKEQIILIAKDVLARIASGQVTAADGGYVNFKDINPETLDLQKLLAQGEKCEACALGAAVLGIAHFEDKISLKKYACYHIVSMTEIETRLVDLLGREQLELIEHAYEGHSMGHFGREVLRLNQMHQCRDFVYKNPGRHHRLVAIWTQLAETGIFDPSLTTGSKN